MTKAIVVAFGMASGILSRSLIVARAQKEGILYMMHTRLCKSEVNVATNSAPFNTQLQLLLLSLHLSWPSHIP